ncbi:trypsin-like serine peptidase [Streptomyces sp. NPDC002073]|uniref:trypsin-like serine peptidase n=1 Tax=Streptomyces sp. NBC_00239 TaxID=2903640 RepID=UPI002E2B8C60|nr:serine protease [Streptomyces sp. NBC_00239]
MSNGWTGSPVATNPKDVFKDLLEVAGRVRENLNAEIVEGVEDLPPDEAAADQIGRFAREERARVLEAGASGLEKLAAGQGDEIDEDEYFGIEAIVLLEGRPAILVQGRDFVSQQGDWAVLDAHRPRIKDSLARVGRVEVAGHPRLDWLGTAFLVGTDVVMTNRHVAAEFARGDSAGATFRQGMSARVDTGEEFGITSVDGSPEYEVTEVLGIHSEVDMALLRVAPAAANGEPLPTPLTVAAEPPHDLIGRPVYVIGYPAADGRRNEPEAMRRIFMDVFNVKRLQPGTATDFVADQTTLKHDCSTLGGNSGSPVFDLDDHRVLGLHFGGRFRSANFAVPLWQLQDDALIRRAGINFE